MKEIAQIRWLSLWIFLVPFVAINICLLISVNYHIFQNTFFIVDQIGRSGFTIPYFDGSLSISRASRTFPQYLIFKPGMVITAFLLCFYWYKNNLLINKDRGSYFFLAELIIDLELEYDPPIKDYCGTCTRCIDACPTDAIAPEGYWMDGSKCISYFTIELKEALPIEMKGTFDNWMFGCDICQQVCPWNRFAQKHQEPDFEPHPDLLEMRQSDWQEITTTVFNKVFKKSAVKRTKYQGLVRNINFLK